MAKHRPRAEVMFQSERPSFGDSGAEVSLATLGLTPEDPVARFVLQALFRAQRYGANVLSPDVQALCVSHGREAYKQWRASEVDRDTKPGVVYYLQINGYIKIGTAADLQARLAHYPPGTEVLAVEPGSYELETTRLRQFGEYLAARREWFRPGPRLMAHIEALQRAGLADAS